MEATTEDVQRSMDVLFSFKDVSDDAAEDKQHQDYTRIRIIMAATSEDRPSQFTAFLAGLYQRLLSPDFVANLVKENKLDDMFFQRSKDVLFSFEDVSDAAEGKQLQDPALKKWLDLIKDGFYVADHLLNQIAAISKPVEEVSTLKGIIHRLESILEHKDFLGPKQFSSVDLSYRTPTSLVEGHDRIYGRDADKEAIMELLLKDNNDANISVIPIVGMGGVGKTTLAQLVYNDDNLKQNFDLKAWVCVPEYFDILKITKTMIEAVTSSPCIVNEGLIYELKQLSDEDIWLMLSKYEDLSSRFSINSTREKIGREIVNKCKGSPLAVQIIGGLLRTKHNIEDWNNILTSDIWKSLENENAITPAMEICYQYLPAHLKRCFAFCSLLPKDYKFNKDELISLWIAQGLLQSSNSEKTLEEIGDEYLHDLVSRSFLQHSSLDGSYGSFVMHDHIRYFAAYKAYELRTFLPLNLKEDLSTRTLPTWQGTGWIQILPFPSMTLPTIFPPSILQHQWMISIKIWNLRLQIELWRLVGFVSGVIGMLCLALSPSFSHLIGGWNSFKFFLYGVAVFLLCITTMLAKKCTLSRHGMLKAHVGFAVLILTSLYSFWHDKAVNEKPDLWSMISNGAFALMSLSLSRVLKLEFEEGLFTFFLGSLVIQLATIKLVLIPVAIVYGLPLYLIHFNSNAESDYLPSLRILD